MTDTIARFPATVAMVAKATVTAPLPLSNPFRWRAPFFFPKVGDEVSFARSPSHASETGYVRSREFGTRCIEVVDANAKTLRLMPGQYRSKSR